MTVARLAPVSPAFAFRLVVQADDDAIDPGRWDLIGECLIRLGERGRTQGPTRFTIHKGTRP